MVRHLVAAVLLLVVQHVSAQSAVYRCDSGGKVSYGSVPCVGDSATAPLVTSPVEPGSRTSADGTLQRQKALADQLARERHQREAQALREQQQAAARRLHCDKLQLRKKWRDEDAAKASASARAKMQRAARRSAEELALSCPS
jgi:hypothetical protein